MLSMDLLLSSQGIKHRGESAYYQFKPRTFAKTKVTSKKVKDFTRKWLFAQIYIIEANDLTTAKLSIFCRLQISLTMPNLCFHGQRELSTGLQLQLKVQNHIAISNCWLTCSQVGAKGPVIPSILDCK